MESPPDKIVIEKAVSIDKTLYDVHVLCDEPTGVHAARPQRHIVEVDHVLAGWFMDDKPLAGTIISHDEIEKWMQGHPGQLKLKDLVTAKIIEHGERHRRR